MTVGILYSPLFLDHVADGYHPERPERLEAVLSGLDRAGVYRGAQNPLARPATREELSRVHDAQYVSATLAELSEERDGYLDGDTFYSEGTRAAALGAAGTGIDLARAVHRRDIDWGWAVVRPPGHHAGTRRAAGFCIFNNIAVAAASLLASGEAERVAIFDWDVHHGNGTQEQFWDDPRVLFSSVHQWPHYPGSGLSTEAGGPLARGTTVNFPFPAGCGDADYLSVIDLAFAPLLRAFAPDHILVSAGFDAHESDPLGGMRVTAAGFGAMASRLGALASELCDGRLTLFLEGGYCLEALSDSARAVALALAGNRGQTPGPTGPPSAAARRVMQATWAAVGPHWPQIPEPRFCSE